MRNDIIKFVREKDFTFVKELGEGACGKTVLLFDDILNEHFVCKKFTPFQEEIREELFLNFVREVKLLYLMQHTNVVRVFNNFVYPSLQTGYILMEYIEGEDIEDFLVKNPELLNEIFIQVVAGFRHVEAQNILHRDIRPQNLMVNKDGIVKIIDFGFGKQVIQPVDFDKSISVNPWCDPPSEFAEAKYDFTTEVYFVGKLFERIIQVAGIESFKFRKVLGKMCKFDAGERIQNFESVEREIHTNEFTEIDFTDEEKDSYRRFAEYIQSNLVHIRDDAKYFYDVDRILNLLEGNYRKVLLEEQVPDSSIVYSCFINGGYRYKKKGLLVSVLREFTRLLRSVTNEKKRIILSNLHSRFDAVDRISDQVKSPEDDLPF